MISAKCALWLCLSLACRPLFSSDTVLLNGHIYTAGARNKWVEAVAITGDKIDAVGSNADIGSQRTTNTKVIDLQGKTVIPGITDGTCTYGSAHWHCTDSICLRPKPTSHPRTPIFCSPRSRPMPSAIPKTP